MLDQFPCPEEGNVIKHSLSVAQAEDIPEHNPNSLYSWAILIQTVAAKTLPIV